jgi:hypothetical protein
VRRCTWRPLLAGGDGGAAAAAAHKQLPGRPGAASVAAPASHRCDSSQETLGGAASAAGAGPRAAMPAARRLAAGACVGCNSSSCQPRSSDTTAGQTMRGDTHTHTLSPLSVFRMLYHASTGVPAGLPAAPGVARGVAHTSLPAPGVPCACMLAVRRCCWCAGVLCCCWPSSLSMACEAWRCCTG